MLGAGAQSPGSGRHRTGVVPACPCGGRRAAVIPSATNMPKRSSGQPDEEPVVHIAPASCRPTGRLVPVRGRRRCGDGRARSSLARCVRTVDWEGNANLIRGARAAGVEHFILISVRHASPDHPLELFRMKHRAEEELRASGLAWTIIRPTAYMETWVGLLGTPLLQTGRTRIFGRGRNPINSVSASDVARLVELAVTDPTLRGAAIDAGGPANLTMDQLVETFQAVTGARGKVSHVPLPMMRVMSVLMRPFNPSMAALVAAGVVMDTRDMTFDPSASSSRFPSISLTDLAKVIRRDHPQVRTANVEGIEN